MKRNATLVTVLAAACAAQAGWGLARWMGDEAHAEGPDDAPVYTESAEPALYPGKLLCRTFEADLDGEELALPGDDTDAGRWVRDHGTSWQVWMVSHDVAQKPNGYPQAWLQVCLYPR